MFKKCFSIFVGLVTALMLTVSTVNARQIVITDQSTWPVTTTIAGDTFSLGAVTVSAPGDGIIVNHPNCVFNFADNTIKFGTSVMFLNNVKGFRINNGVAGTIVNGGNIVHQSPDPENNGVGTEGGSDIKCISLNWVPGATFNNVDLFVDGHNANCVHIPGGMTKNIVFNGGIWVSNSNSFASRETYGSALFYSESFGYTLADNEWDVELLNVSMLNSPHVTIVNKGRFHIEGCTLINDGRNVYWDTLYLDRGITAPIGRSFANPYNILCRGMKPGSKIVNNFLGSGNLYGGGRGILVEPTSTLGSGTAALPILFENNTLECHEGPDGENLGGTFRGLRVRGIIDYITFRGNKIFGIVDDDPLTTAIGKDGTSLHWGNQGGSHIIWENNTFEVTAIGTGTNFTARSAMLAGDTYAGFQTNTFAGSGYLINFADMDNASACVNWGILDARFVKGSVNPNFVGTPNFTKFHTFTVGYPARNSTGNYITNGTYESGASNTDIFLNTINGSHSAKTISKFKITVIDNNAPKPNFNLTLKNVYNQTVFQGVTDAAGIATGTMSYYLKSSAGDSTYYPYTLSYVSDTGAVSVVLSGAALADYQINMNGNLPPNSPVIVTPGPYEVLLTNHLTLTWTASDPDGDTLVYDVYLGYDGLSIPTRVATKINVLYFDTTLGWDTAFYGYVKAFDTSNDSTPSQLFHFSTPEEPDTAYPSISSVAWNLTTINTGSTAILTAVLTDDKALANVKVTIGPVGSIPVEVYNAVISGKTFNLSVPIVISATSINPLETIITVTDTKSKSTTAFPLQWKIKCLTTD